MSPADFDEVSPKIEAELKSARRVV